MKEVFIIARGAADGSWGYYRGPSVHQPTAFRGVPLNAYQYNTYGEAQQALPILPGKIFKIDKIFVKNETIPA